MVSAPLSALLFYFVFIIVITVVVVVVCYILSVPICETVTLVVGFTYKWPTTTKNPFMCRTEIILKHTVSVCNREIESSMFVAGDGVVIWNEHRIRLCITSLPSLLLDGRSRFTALLSILVAYATHEQLTVGWPAVIHIRFYIFLFLFFLSLHSRSLTCSLRHYYTTIAAANTVTSSLIHSFITHIRTLSISFVYLPFSVPFCLCRKLIYFFFLLSAFN